MASKNNVRYEETLTGFKWIGNRAIELELENFHVVFGYEEALGYMCHDTVKDKDGISAMLYFAQMAAKLYSEGKTVQKQLSLIYEKYGYFVSNNFYLVCHDPDLIKFTFNTIRFGAQKSKSKDCPYEYNPNYPSEIAGFKVVYVRDLTIGYDSSTPDNKPLLPTSTSSQMISFGLANHCSITLRTSGTEPKVKYYCELNSKGMIDAQSKLDTLVETMISELLGPLAQ